MMDWFSFLCFLKILNHHFERALIYNLPLNRVVTIKPFIGTYDSGMSHRFIVQGQNKKLAWEFNTRLLHSGAEAADDG